MRPGGLLLFLAVSGLAVAGTRAHSHNEYEQPRPLLDALAQHFDVIEADVHLAGVRLLVAHESTQVRSDRTLESLSLDPLRVWLKQKEHYPVILLIDVKTDADPTRRAHDAVLAQYPDLAGLVPFIISGNRARGLMSVQPYCRAALDGRMEDLDSGASADLIPLISDNRAKFFARRGDGPFSGAGAAAGFGCPRPSTGPAAPFLEHARDPRLLAGASRRRG